MTDASHNAPGILIVDDMPINIQILARSLKSDYRVRIATNGAKALEIAGSDDPPDLILLDIVMPGMDGYAVIKALKEDDKTRNIPVIFITVRDKVEDESTGFELGAVDYITKPFHMPVVKARIKTHMNLKRKTDMLEQLALLDGLTNIPNRRRFDEVLEKEWKRAQRNTSPLTLMMIDIDCFKAFNDLYGHSRGDDCLCSVATALVDSLERPGDFVARYGGEEFAVVLPETPEKGAWTMAEKLRMKVQELNIAHENSPVAPCITVSIGAATAIPQQGLPTRSALLETADQMLYEAKSKGRNQCQPIVVS